MNTFENKVFIADSITALDSIAASILTIPFKSKVYLLDGAMGSGKTTLTGKLISFLGSKDQVQSPTFGLVNEYSMPIGHIYHFDFYRINSINEALDIGLEEYLDSGNYCFLEWPDKIESLLHPDYNRIQLKLLTNGSREIQLFIP